MRQTKLGCGAVSVSALLFSVGAHAQESAPAVAAGAVDTNAGRRAKAEQLRQRALSFYDSGDYAAARNEFAHANQLMPSFRLLYNLGVVSLDLADPASAYDYFERYLAEGGELVPPEKRVEVLGQLRALAARIATLTVTVDTPGAEIFVDGVSVGEAPLHHAVHLSPGARTISARLGDRRAAERTLDLATGGDERILLRIPRPAPTVEKTRTPVSLPGWAATAALTAGAALAGFEALSANRDYNHQLGTITSRAELDRLDTRATRWSVTADTLDVAAIVAGAYSLYLTVHHAPAPASAANATGKFSMQLTSNQVKAGFNF